MDVSFVADIERKGAVVHIELVAEPLVQFDIIHFHS